MQDPDGLQERENWEEHKEGTASKPWFQSGLCANIQCAWALRLERKSPKSRNCALSALSQPAPPSGGSEPAKMGLEAAATREWPAGRGGPGQEEKAPCPARTVQTQSSGAAATAAATPRDAGRAEENQSGQQRAGAPSPRSPAPGPRATPPAPPPALASHLVRICRRGGAADAIPTMLRGVPPPSLPPPLPLVEEDGGRRSGGPRHPAI